MTGAERIKIYISRFLLVREQEVDSTLALHVY